ncbi:hypothetical protein E4U50_001777 [Claviceps purpurea]|nr:hypothetical protein E4U28_001208 [Claviceps purpurea]KAG6212865.1 hypothetical protein E4U50_001777 [Claviceps purpurea]
MYGILGKTEQTRVFDQVDFVAKKLLRQSDVVICRNRNMNSEAGLADGTTRPRTPLGALQRE